MIGIHVLTEYGGLGLDLKYQAAMVEALGYVRALGICMGIGVQTDVATPSLARYSKVYES